ncbi:hypothetical protein N9917_01175 [Deltaproteobacteria bacterium]|nr:hypothetical protein [Deltaproteobacteria bacterium]
MSDVEKALLFLAEKWEGVEKPKTCGICGQPNDGHRHTLSEFGITMGPDVLAYQAIDGEDVDV